MSTKKFCDACKGEIYDAPFIYHERTEKAVGRCNEAYGLDNPVLELCHKCDGEFMRAYTDMVRRKILARRSTDAKELG